MVFDFNIYFTNFNRTKMVNLFVIIGMSSSLTCCSIVFRISYYCWNPIQHLNSTSTKKVLREFWKYIKKAPKLISLVLVNSNNSWWTHIHTAFGLNLPLSLCKFGFDFHLQMLYHPYSYEIFFFWCIKL